MFLIRLWNFQAAPAGDDDDDIDLFGDETEEEKKAAEEREASKKASSKKKESKPSQTLPTLHGMLLQKHVINKVALGCAL